MYGRLRAFCCVRLSPLGTQVMVSKVPRSQVKQGWSGWFVTIATLAVLGLSGARIARAQSAAVLEFRYTPVTRAQVAIWVEDANGKFLSTVALTEATAFRGIGNRPGASQMNSGYRWPYGRREGVLPIWAHRRASAPGAKLFPRVIFQMRTEGFASQTQSDQSRDIYYCLQFDMTKSTKDELDAVSCATQFNSDKGRYLTQADVDKGYSEPYEQHNSSGSLVGIMQPMPLKSMYPARMDTSKCPVEGACFDGDDVDHFADDVRAVMPDIDAVTKATAPGDSPQKLLFTVPKAWAQGDYVAWIEVNVEGDYNEDAASPATRMLGWNTSTYPSPTSPDDKWDYYAKAYGYSYRGQPSVVYKVPFKLGPAGEVTTATDMPVGRSSWDVWATDYGKLEPVSFTASEAGHLADQNGSGADRLRRDGQGHRFSVTARVSGDLPPSQPQTEPVADAGMEHPDAGVMMDAGTAMEPPPPGTGEEPPSCGAKPASDSGSSNSENPPQMPTDKPAAETMESVSNGSSDGVVIEDSGDCQGGPVGPIEGLQLRRHPNKLRSHEWVLLRFKAAHSQQKLHAYEVRVSTEPIVDAVSFMRYGREARNATDDAEGATALMLPTDVPEGRYINTAIGDLVADTHYFVAVRATDDFNQHGPISVAEINTPARTFATVTACFVATAAYGSPLATEIDALRRFRDRQLSATAPGRVLVQAYQEFGPRAARVIAQSDTLRSWVRAALAPVIALVRRLP
jgi:hypothetical protein